MAGRFIRDRSHTVHAVIRSESLRNRHLSHNARPTFAFFTVTFPISFWPMGHKPTTALRYRCSINISIDEIHSPSCVPVASGTYGFLGRSRNSVLVTHSRECFPDPLYADHGLFLATPTTRKLLVALGLHLVLRCQTTMLSPARVIIGPASLYHQAWQGSLLGARLVIAVLGSTGLWLPLSSRPCEQLEKNSADVAFPFADCLRT